MTDTLEFIRAANDMRLVWLNVAAFFLFAVPAVIRFAHWLNTPPSLLQGPHKQRSLQADALAGRIYYGCAVVYLALNVIP